LVPTEVDNSDVTAIRRPDESRAKPMQVAVFFRREYRLSLNLDGIRVIANCPQLPGVFNISNPRAVWRPHKSRSDQFLQLAAGPCVEHKVDAVIRINRPLTEQPRGVDPSPTFTSSYASPASSIRLDKPNVRQSGIDMAPRGIHHRAHRGSQGEKPQCSPCPVVMPQTVTEKQRSAG